MRLANGVRFKVAENLSEIYDDRGWCYYPEIHDVILGKEGTITSIEPKYLDGYCNVTIDGTTYTGTLPVEGLEDI